MRDNLLFVLVLLIPALVAANAYLEQRRRVDDIARGQPSTAIAGTPKARPASEGATFAAGSPKSETIR